MCEQAGVKLEVVPLTDQYWQRVVSHCLTEIKAGRTPNPDVLCNSRCVLTCPCMHKLSLFGRFAYHSRTSKDAHDACLS